MNPKPPSQEVQQAQPEKKESALAPAAQERLTQLMMTNDYQNFVADNVKLGNKVTNDKGTEAEKKLFLAGLDKQIARFEQGQA